MHHPVANLVTRASNFFSPHSGTCYEITRDDRKKTEEQKRDLDGVIRASSSTRVKERAGTACVSLGERRGRTRRGVYPTYARLPSR